MRKCIECGTTRIFKEYKRCRDCYNVYHNFVKKFLLKKGTK